MSSLGTCGRYELVRFLDAGGMGEIFLARGPGPHGEADLVALKRLLPQVAQDPTIVEMFVDEARLAMRLDHPNIVRVHSAGRDGDDSFLVMEWVDGASLRAMIRRSASAGPIPWNVAARVIADAALGLDYAHRLADASGRSYEIVHRDVSPPNIMVGYDGRTRLLDFGLARARTHLQKTKPGLVKGKFAYIAPEQLRGEITPRVDVFALGLCLWEALAGRPVIDDSTPAAAMMRIQELREAPQVPRDDLPAGIGDAIGRALAPDPASRFQTALEMRDALERILVREGERADGEAVTTWVSRAFPPPVDDEVARASTVPPPPPAPAALVDVDAPGASRARSWLVVIALIVVAAAAAAFAAAQ